MIALKTLLMMVGVLLMTLAAGIPLHGLWMQLRYGMKKKSRKDGMVPESNELEPEPSPVMWKGPVALAMVACMPLLMAGSMVVVPSGMGGVRVSQIGGTEPGTLYPGLHFMTPMIESVQMFDLRDHLFTAGVVDAGKPGTKKNMTVQSREGLNIGMAVTVRYRLDPNKLSSVQAHLPQPADQQLVPPVVASAWRELAPSYTVREIFSSKREEVRNRAAGIISKKLATDGIVVEEVMLSDIQLPEQYAKGLEGLLLKEQQDDQMAIDTDIQQKQVRIAELQAEAEAKQKAKHAEGDARAKVIEAKGEADAMQYTLPLKQKQIEQTKLEAQARKEATI